SFPNPSKIGCPISPLPSGDWCLRQLPSGVSFWRLVSVSVRRGVSFLKRIIDRGLLDMVTVPISAVVKVTQKTCKGRSDS
ncbi:hypothetical protein LINGRAHAP2_LOCUS31028, partial [Linum grandiflorum]